MYLWTIYIFPGSICRYFDAAKEVERSREYVNRSQIHESTNWEWGRAVSFLGIHRSDLLCSAPSNWEVQIRRNLYFSPLLWVNPFKQNEQVIEIKEDDSCEYLPRILSWVLQLRAHVPTSLLFLWLHYSMGLLYDVGRGVSTTCRRQKGLKGQSGQIRMEWNVKINDDILEKLSLSLLFAC